jgi:hypothetical protein
VLAIALANKLARIAWAVLHKGRMATLAREARQARRPTLTGPACGASLHPQVGTKERPLGTNKGTGRNEEQAMT